jgi:prevent-host-death family protein
MFTTVVNMGKPDLIVPAAEANRSFSKLLRAAREGRRVTITAYGEPVAELVPAGASREAERAAERARLLEGLRAHWERAPMIVVGPWSREELYERD